MRHSTLVRIIGGMILLVNLYIVGHYNIKGPMVLVMTFGFAIVWELLFVQRLRKKESASSAQLNQ